jgi:hypothetical protein
MKQTSILQDISYILISNIYILQFHTAQYTFDLLPLHNFFKSEIKNYNKGMAWG